MSCEPMESRGEKLERIEKPKLLVVEGFDEERLLKCLNLIDIQIVNCRGKDNMPSVIKGLPSRPGFSNVLSLGIIRDAEENSSSAFQSVRDALSSAGLPIPTTVEDFQSGHPRVGVLIIPPGARQGMLEDLCLKSVEDDPALACVDEFFKCIETKAGRAPKSISRSRVHAYLASLEDPYIRIGEAAEKGIWQIRSTAFEGIVHFLQQI